MTVLAIIVIAFHLWAAWAVAETMSSATFDMGWKMRWAGYALVVLNICGAVVWGLDIFK